MLFVKVSKSDFLSFINSYAESHHVSLATKSYVDDAGVFVTYYRADHDCVAYIRFESPRRVYHIRSFEALRK